ncbi:hypothetical protein MA03_03745 [Infirmifilum uzonense]|uniref:EVE domain-containing protein n=1 Tax=Infirmifilum uzonense TaxID=1550241 RepID=A0A0F7FH80_9CREN|nr:EVE domain-containing protein [Infirmifilum uzonense]AKG38577.1 hypothetical protein MA03_03745 [Infirmifilum uzonense]
MGYWALVGTIENWELALQKGVWGVSEKAKPLWQRVQPGDKVVFYAVKTGILGYGTVQQKFISNDPLWPREKQEGRALWPYRLTIKIEEKFEKPKPRPKNMFVAFAINKLTEQAFNEAIH